VNILDQIVQTKQREVEHLRPRAAELLEEAEAAPASLDFHEALARPAEVSLIAEVKRRSPGAGPIRMDLDPAGLAARYADCGASALSVLTDREYFAGALSDLHAARAASGLPALRKDFTIDPLQVLEARANGADAVLLIVRILEDPLLRDLHQLATELGMAVLVETHGPGELERAIEAGARIVGVNNRDLSTFETRIEVTLDLLPRIPSDVVLVSESGIRTRDQVERLGGAGVDGILVGETLLRADDPGEAASLLSGVPRNASARLGS
jgi:indole-3-glycerol phosphate synthase